MPEVASNSTQYLANDDLNAIAIYFKDIPARSLASNVNASRIDTEVMKHGEGLYLDNCAACHMENGEGLLQVFPSLAGSAAIQAEHPDTVVHLVLAGAKIPATSTKPTGLAMPAFQTKLNDQEIAALVSYIRNAWGNHAPSVDTAAVSAMRKDIMQTSGR